MQIKGAFDPTSFLSINPEDFLKYYILGKGVDLIFKKVNLWDKLRFSYYSLRCFKYEILYNYSGWKLDRKSGYAKKFINRQLSKTEQYYLMQQIVSGILYKPEKATEAFNVWWPLFKNVHPEKFREFFGESKDAIQAKLNIQKFFQNVFA